MLRCSLSPSRTARIHTKQRGNTNQGDTRTIPNRISPQKLDHSESESSRLLACGSSPGALTYSSVEAPSSTVPIRPRVVPVEQQLETIRKTSKSCPACFKRNCQLKSHKSYGLNLHKRKLGLYYEGAFSTATPVRDLSLDSSFSSSYAFQMAQMIQRKDESAATTLLTRFLSVPKGYVNDKSSRLYLNWFADTCVFDPVFKKPPNLECQLLHIPFFHMSLVEPAVYFGILACAIAALNVTEQKSPDTRVTALTHVGQAMQRMRLLLNKDPQHPSDMVIAASAMLCVTQWYLRDAEALSQHLDQMYTLVQVRGGILHLDSGGFLEDYIRWVDIWTSMFFRRECRFTSLCLRSGVTFVKSVSSGFWEWASSNETISRIDMRLVLAYRRALALMFTCREFQLYSPSVPVYASLMNELQSLLCDLSPFLRQFQNGTDMNECLTLALFTLIIKVFWISNAEQAMLLTRYTNWLFDAIGKSGGALFWHQNIPLFIWLLFVLELADGDMGKKRKSRHMLHKSLSVYFGTKTFSSWPENWQHRIERGLVWYMWPEHELRNVFDSTCINIARIMQNDLDSSSSE